MNQFSEKIILDLEITFYLRSKHIDNRNKMGYEQERKYACIKLRINCKLHPKVWGCFKFYTPKF